MNEDPPEVKHQSTPSNASTIIGSTLNNQRKIGVMDNSTEGFDVFQITKKIQEQTRTIEDEIKKVAELLRKQQENSIQKSISKQTLNKDYLTNRHSMHKNSTPMPVIGEHSNSMARHAHSLEPIAADQFKNNRSMPEKINLSKQFNQTPQNVIGSQFSTIEKGGNSRLKNAIDEEQVTAQRSSEYTYGDNSIKSKRKLKEREIEVDQIPANLNVQIMPQTSKRGEAGAAKHDINKQRDKFFSGNNKHDQDNLPNNTFHKLFNGQTEYQIGGSGNIPHQKNNSPHGSIQNEDIRVPNPYGESPQQIVKSKVRRIAQASNDRRGGATESLPNPQNIRESLELQNLGKGQSNEPLRIPGQTKQFKNSKHQLEALNHDNSQHIKAVSESQLRKLQQNDPLTYNSGSVAGAASNQMQQKVAMNNFLTPIVFVSNNYHGVQPRVAPNNDYQEYVGEYDQIKGIKQKQGQMGYPNSQPLNRDIMFEPDSNYNPQQMYNNNPTYFPPLNSHNLYRPLSKHHNPLNNRVPQGTQVSATKQHYRQQQQQQQTSLRQEYQDVLSDHPNNAYEPQGGGDSQLSGGNLAGAQARLGALMQKMPMNALNQQYSQNSPSPNQGENSKRNKMDGKMGKKRRQSAVRGGPDNNMNDDEEQMDTVGELTGNQNNIFYQSIHVELPDDRTMQDQQMRQYCQNLEIYIQTASSKLDLVMNRIRLNHPIFKMISASTFSYIVERSFLFKLQNNYGAYQEGYRAMNNLYFVLYGEISLMKKGQGQIGHIMTMGYTLGEEILFSDRDPIVRQESCLCTHPEGSALLQINVDDFIKLGLQKHLMLGRGGKDFKVLMGILQNNFEMKQQWREQQQAIDNKSSGGNHLHNR